MRHIVVRSDTLFSQSFTGFVDHDEDLGHEARAREKIDRMISSECMQVSEQE